VSKTQQYRDIHQQAAGLTHGETDMIANMANISALLWMYLQDINWAGFYLLKGEELVLGPFQGKPACIRIPLGKGVCGTAAASGKTQLVEDVHQFAGHIACDAASNSEIVLPIFKNNELIAVLDIDSPLVARFDQDDALGLQAIVDVIQATLD
jgi:L-methionine (R)-S-oxide reductase